MSTSRTVWNGKHSPPDASAFCDCEKDADTEPSSPMDEIEKKMLEIQKARLTNVYDTPPENDRIIPDIWELYHLNSGRPVESMEKENDGKRCSSAPASVGKENFGMGDIEDARRKIKDKWIWFNDQIYWLIMTFYETCNERVSYAFMTFVKKCIDIGQKLSIDIIEPSEDDITNDTEILKNMFFLLICFPISIFSMYNWYYLLIIRMDVTPPDKVKEEYKIDFNSIENDILKRSLTYLFGYCLYPVQCINYYLLNERCSPVLIQNIPKEIIKKIILLLIVFHLTYEWGFFNAFKSLFYGLPHSITFLSMGFIGLLFTLHLIKAIIKYKEDPLIKFTFLSSTLYNIFNFTIQFLIAVFSVPIASFIVLIYFWAHSLFGIMFYFSEQKWGEELNSMNPFSDVLSQIKERCNKEIQLLSDDCLENWPMKLWVAILHLFNEYDYFIVFFFILFFMIGYAQNFMRINEVKNLTSLLFLVAMIFIFVNIVVWMKDYAKNKW